MTPAGAAGGLSTSYLQRRAETKSPGCSTRGPAPGGARPNPDSPESPAVPAWLSRLEQGAHSLPVSPSLPPSLSLDLSLGPSRTLLIARLQHVIPRGQWAANPRPSAPPAGCPRPVQHADSGPPRGLRTSIPARPSEGPHFETAALSLSFLLCGGSTQTKRDGAEDFTGPPRPPTSQRAQLGPSLGGPGGCGSCVGCILIASHGDSFQPAGGACAFVVGEMYSANEAPFQ